MLKKLFKDKFFINANMYLFLSFFNSAVSFFLLPVLTRYLSPEDYGTVSLFTVFTSIFYMILTLNLPAAIPINYYQIEKLKLKSYIGHILLTIFLLSIIWAIIIYLIKSTLSQFINIQPKWLLLSVIIVLCRSFREIYLSVCRMDANVTQYLKVSIANLFLNVGLSLILVVAFLLNWEGRLLGILISTILVGFACLMLFLKEKRISFNLENYSENMKDAGKIGIPLIFHTIGTLIINSADKITLNILIGTYSVGIYTVGYQFGAILGMITYAFNQAWVPFLFKKLTNIDLKEKMKIVRYNYLYFILMLLGAGCLTIIAPFLIDWFIGKEFENARIYVFWIALGYAANGMYNRVADYIFFVKKTHYLAFVTFLTALINIILNFIFIKANGAIGAAQATAVAFFMSFCLTWILSAKIYPMPWLLTLKTLLKKKAS